MLHAGTTTDFVLAVQVKVCGLCAAVTAAAVLRGCACFVAYFARGTQGGLDVVDSGHQLLMGG